MGRFVDGKLWRGSCSLCVLMLVLLVLDAAVTAVAVVAAAAAAEIVVLGPRACYQPVLYFTSHIPNTFFTAAALEESMAQQRCTAAAVAVKAQQQSSNDRWVVLSPCRYLVVSRLQV